MIWIKKDKIKQLYWIEIVKFKEQGLNNNNNNNLVNKFKVSEPYNDLSLIMIICFLNCLIWSSLNNFSAQEFKSKFKMDFYSWPRFGCCWLFLCTIIFGEVVNQLISIQKAGVTTHHKWTYNIESRPFHQDNSFHLPKSSLICLLWKFSISIFS
jgi:hypothetical protein